MRNNWAREIEFFNRPNGARAKEAGSPCSHFLPLIIHPFLAAPVCIWEYGYWHLAWGTAAQPTKMTNSHLQKHKSGIRELSDWRFPNTGIDTTSSWERLPLFPRYSRKNRVEIYSIQRTGAALSLLIGKDAGRDARTLRMWAYHTRTTA